MAIPVYTHAVAKVMISIPDDLLARLDGQARRRGTTRSGLLRQLAERELTGEDEARGAGIERLLAGAGPHGGDAAGHVRAQRRAR
jgi:predicted transcriptional regulator